MGVLGPIVLLSFSTAGWVGGTVDLKDACEGGNAKACTQLAGVFARGEGVRRSFARAARLLSTACDRGDMEACGQLGALWATGEGVVAADSAEADILFRRACDGGDGAACFSLAMASALAGGEGELEEPERKAFVRLMSLSCERDYAEACRWLSAAYRSGEDIPRDAARAADFERRARALLDPPCEAGNARACIQLTEDSFGNLRDGQSAPDRRLRERATALLKTACDKGRLGRDGCVGLGSLYLENKVPGMDDVDAAIGPLERACRGGFYEGCDGLSRLVSTYSQGGLPETEAKLVRLRGACVISEACGGRGAGPATDPLDQPLGDAPGSSRIRDRWVARAYDKAAPLPERFEAAEVVARLGSPDLVAPVLERQKVDRTFRAMGDIRRRALSREDQHVSSGSAAAIPALSQADMEGFARQALRSAREPNDGWGRPLRFHVLPGDSKRRPWEIEVRSDGPDQVPGTKDDLSTLNERSYDDDRYAALDFTPAESAERAIEVLETKCATDDYLPFLSCQAAVEIHLAGKAIPKNPRRAIEVYDLACKRSIVEACEAATRLLTSGDRVARDETAAEQFRVRTRAILERACAPGGRYRTTYAPRLIEMYERGEGGPRDIPRALALCEFLRADGGNGGCPALERLKAARTHEKPLER